MKFHFVVPPASKFAAGFKNPGYNDGKTCAQGHLAFQYDGSNSIFGFKNYLKEINPAAFPYTEEPKALGAAGPSGPLGTYNDFLMHIDPTGEMARQHLIAWLRAYFPNNEVK